MAGFQTDVLDHIARVVGGTVSTTDSHFFSGDQANDGTGVAGLKGCWSETPNGIQSTPVAIVMPAPFTATLNTQGKEPNEDHVKIQVLVAKYDLKSQMGVLTPFRDSVPAAFRAHMQAFAIPDIIDCFITAGRPGVGKYGSDEYLAWDFDLRVRRLLSVTYVV